MRPPRSLPPLEPNRRRSRWAWFLAIATGLMMMVVTSIGWWFGYFVSGTVVYVVGYAGMIALAVRAAGMHMDETYEAIARRRDQMGLVP